MIHLRRRTAVGLSVRGSSPTGSGRFLLPPWELSESFLGSAKSPASLRRIADRFAPETAPRPGFHTELTEDSETPPSRRSDASAMNMRTRTIVLYTTLTVAVVGAGGLAYGAIDSSGSSSTKTATRLVSATVGTVSQTVSATGTVQPATSLDLNFATGGVLTAVRVKAGAKVGIGQVLATIDPAKATVGLESAQAAQ